MRPIRIHNMDIIFGQAVVRWSDEFRAWVHEGDLILRRAKAQRLAARLNYLIQVRL